MCNLLSILEAKALIMVVSYSFLILKIVCGLVYGFLVSQNQFHFLCVEIYFSYLFFFYLNASFALHNSMQRSYVGRA